MGRPSQVMNSPFLGSCLSSGFCLNACEMIWDQADTCWVWYYEVPRVAGTVPRNGNLPTPEGRFWQHIGELKHASTG